MTSSSRFGFNLKSGDILYSGKNKYTWGVGHVGILGTDGLVRHVIPRGKQIHSIDEFLTNFIRVSVLRYIDEKVSYEAAEMSEVLYHEISRYSLHPSLRSVQKNHCTKFVWQCFYHSQAKDILWNVPNTRNLIILPSFFKYATKGSFYKVLTFHKALYLCMSKMFTGL